MKMMRMMKIKTKHTDWCKVLENSLDILNAMTPKQIDEGYNRCLLRCYEIGAISREEYKEMKR